MIRNLETQLFGNGLLAGFDGLVEKLLDAPAIETHDVIVMLAFRKLEHRVIRLEIITIDNTGLLELGKHAVHRCQTDILAGAEKITINIFRAQVPLLTGLEDLHDLDTRQRDLKTCFAKLFALQVGAFTVPGTA